MILKLCLSIIANIKDLLKLKWYAILSHSLKDNNLCAYFLAKMDSTNDEKFTIREAPPKDLKIILLSDSAPLRKGVAPRA